MSWDKKHSEAMASMLAASAIGMIRDDPELLGRFRTELARTSCPIPAEKITPDMLRALEMALIMRAGVEMKGGGIASEGQAMGVPIPVPQIEDGARYSVLSMGLGSFLAEYMAGHPDARALFNSWMTKERPGDEPGREFTQGEFEVADELLTLMAATVSEKMLAADDEDTVTVPDEAKEQKIP